jgi:hypothetical protein
MALKVLTFSFLNTNKYRRKENCLLYEIGMFLNARLSLVTGFYTAKGGSYPLFYHHN